ncbi:cytochrome B [Meridianimarinicoccus roseus]|uniref:Cytochrome B n=1 Tax=Meridianimarinicoccus roseus TaxID=2072018 RepID=A0A2V2LDK5_9RHOB|nr:cytochrome b/b6 domain-containing protein [Meridianimarinicoccus roseus]PWR01594.1 cytochrome B [Meridianimarinicoccus roseus]
MQMERYTLVQRLLHWIIAVLVLGSLAGGAMLYSFGFEGLRDTFGMDVTNTIYTAHKTLGLLILGLMLLRVAARYGLGVPPPAPTLNGFERAASAAVHGALYVGLIGMTLLGWLATGAGGFPVEFFSGRLPGILPKNEGLSETLFWMHGLVAVGLVGLIALHTGAAMMHWKVKKDGVMERMMLWGGGR